MVSKAWKKRQQKSLYYQAHKHKTSLTLPECQEWKEKHCMTQKKYYLSRRSLLRRQKRLNYAEKQHTFSRKRMRLFPVLISPGKPSREPRQVHISVERNSKMMGQLSRGASRGTCKTVLFKNQQCHCMTNVQFCKPALKPRQESGNIKRSEINKTTLNGGVSRGTSETVLIKGKQHNCTIEIQNLTATERRSKYQPKKSKILAFKGYYQVLPRSLALLKNRLRVRRHFLRLKPAVIGTPSSEKVGSPKVTSARRRQVVNTGSSQVSNKFRKKNTTFKKLSIFSNTLRRRNVFKLWPAQTTLVDKIALKCGGSKPSATLRAKRLVSWCILSRNRCIHSFRKKADFLKSKCKTYVDLYRSSSSWQERSEVILGNSLHTSNTESYFTDSSYHSIQTLPSQLQMNEDGKIMNAFPSLSRIEKKGYSWQCISLCNVKAVDATKNVHRTFRRLRHPKSERHMVIFIRDLNNCNSFCSQNTRQGHSLACRINNGNGTPLVVLQNLMPHYPQLRGVVRTIQEMKRTLNEINGIDRALSTANLSDIERLAGEAKTSGGAFRVGNMIYEHEDSIVAKHNFSFKAFTKKMSDLPLNYCFSCQRLCFTRELTQIARMIKKPENKTWKELQAYAHDQKLLVKYVCDFCLKKIRSDQLPAVASLNSLQVGPIPSVIQNLNAFERIFVQRAKAFQVVTKMGAVSNQNMPATHKVQKVVGRTFHLPLPIEETLKRVLEPQEAIMPNQEFFILVRGLPSKQKAIWQSLVNVSNVYEALTWYKKNNPLYAEIKLPNSAEDLFSFLDDTEAQYPQTSKNGELSEESPVSPAGDERSVDPRAAMLTQMNEDNCFYDQYTIHPIAEKRENKSGAELYQMCRIEEAALDSREKNLDLLCFPDLYPYGKHGSNDESRHIPLQFADFVKARIISRFSMFRLNVQYIFFLLNLVNMRQLAAGIYQVLNTSREKLTASELIKKLEAGSLEGNLTNIFGRLRNTEQYWKSPRSDIFCMIENYGSPTFSLTLSPADYDDTELESYLREVNKGNKAEVKHFSALIASDPVSVSRYLDQKFKAMLDFITAPDGPLGTVEHYDWRREYQGRGTQHFHLLIWIKNAPILGVSSDTAVVQFIQKTITCSIPDRKTFPELYKKVLRYQVHHHNSYCLRAKQDRGRAWKKFCRFGFPRVVTDKLVLRNVATSIAGRRTLNSKARLYDLPRNETETFVNDYNAAIMLAWTGNCDLQFVGENSAVIAKYITKYQTKAGKSHMVEIFDNINSTKSLHSRLWNVALRGLSHRECGALKAADTLLGIPLYGTDTDTVIRWIDVRLLRNRKMKSRQQIENLCPDDTNLFCPSFVDTHYPNRPAQLENMSLHDFACYCDTIPNEPKRGDTIYYRYPGNDSLFYRLRKKNPYLIKHIHFDPKKQPEEYFFSILLLFKPWREIKDLRGNHDSFSEAFNVEKDFLVDAMQYHKKQTEILAAEGAVEKLIEEALAEDENANQEAPNGDNYHEADDALPFEAAGAMEEFRANLQDEKDDFGILESQLNPDQHRVYSHVQSAMKQNGPPLRQFVSGVGGTVKSFLIRVIKLWVKQVLQKDVAVTAPTGIAAFNVNGLTIHRLLQLPIEHGTDVKYTRLSDAVLQVLRLEMKNVALVIIDEISMVSNVTLRFIHMRLSEIFDTSDEDDGWFGKIHLLVFGDLLQVPPVKAKSPFDEMDTSECQKYFASVSNINLWKNYFTYDELQINMRQRSDEAFCDMLNNVRLGFCSTEHLRLLQSRQIQFKSDSIPLRLQELS